MAHKFKSVVQLDSGLLIPAGAGSGKVLTSDVSGNATWQTVSGAGTSEWINLLQGISWVGGLTAGTATTYIFTTPGASNGTASSNWVYQADTTYIDPADYTIAGKTLQWRIVVSVLTNATAPASTFVPGLYPLSASVVASNANTPTLGTVLAGSTVSIASPAASSELKFVTSTFSIATADHFVLALTNSATTATNSSTKLSAKLQYQYI